MRVFAKKQTKKIVNQKNIFVVVCNFIRDAKISNISVFVID